jgi:hypothetical protein
VYGVACIIYSDVRKQTDHSEETCELYFCVQFKSLRIKLNIGIVSIVSNEQLFFWIYI